MRDRVSPTFIAAGVVIGLSCFILLSMLFYDTVDYYERSDAVAAQDGFRFSVANTFFRSLGVGAYLGWMVILGWGIVIFFREQVGDLALRGASLVVVIVSGAAVASLLGAEQHGGSLGVAVGGILSAGLGSTIGAIMMFAIFAASFLYATDYGFFRYVKQAREAVAVMEVEAEEQTEVEQDKPTDWSKLIDQTVTEVTVETPEGIDEEMEEDLLAETTETFETEEAEEPVAEVEEEDEESESLVLNFQSIETEDLDEDLLVSGESEEPVVVAPKPVVTIEEEAEDELLATDEAEEPVEAEETTSEVLLEEDLLLSDEVAETAREMLAALQPPVVEETAEPESEFAEGLEEPVAEPETEEPVAEEEEEDVPVAVAVNDGGENDEGGIVEEAAEEEIIEVEPIEETPEPVAEEKPAAPAPGDVDSVFDALLGFPPAAAEEEEEPEPTTKPTNGTAVTVAAPVTEIEEEPVEEEVAVAEEPEFEEPGFILTDDVIVVEEEVPDTDEPEAPEPESVEEEPVAETPVTEEPVREELEQEIVEEIGDEVTAETFVEQVILVDERLDRTTDGETGEEDAEAPLLPFMAEETPEAMEPVAEPAPEAEAEEEIPVLEDVSTTGKKPGVLRSIFGKKDKASVRPGDPLLDESAALVIEKGRASVVFLQRRLDIGYTRASRLIDAMERHGLVGPLEESGSREVLMSIEEWEEFRG